MEQQPVGTLITPLLSVWAVTPAAALGEQNFTGQPLTRLTEPAVVTHDGIAGSLSCAHSPCAIPLALILGVSPTHSGFFEKTANLWRAQVRRLRLDFKNFQRHVTFADEEVEGWREEIRDGARVGRRSRTPHIRTTHHTHARICTAGRFRSVVHGGGGCAVRRTVARHGQRSLPELRGLLRRGGRPRRRGRGP